MFKVGDHVTLTPDYTGFATLYHIDTHHGERIHSLPTDTIYKILDICLWDESARLTSLGPFRSDTDIGISGYGSWVPFYCLAKHSHKLQTRRRAHA